MPSSDVSALRELLTGFKRIFDTGEFSDLTICSSNRKYAVHRAVICPQSPFLWAACTRNFEVSIRLCVTHPLTVPKEQKCQEIDLRADDPVAVHCMVHYFYSKAYPVHVEEKDSVLSTVADTTCPESSHDAIGEEIVGDNISQHDQEGLSVTHSAEESADAQERRDTAFGGLHQDVMVYVLAEKYGIPDLQTQAARHFIEQLQCSNSTVDVIDIVRDVYAETPPHDQNLRDGIVAQVYSEIQYLVEKPRFMEAMVGEAEFCADLLKYTVQENLKQYEAALATIDKPEYCEKCQATVIGTPWNPKRGNVNTKKYGPKK